MTTKQKAQLDNSWIEDGLIKLQSNFSNVIFFETDDRQRYSQLVRYLPTVTSLSEHQIYELSPWAGLQRIGKTGAQAVSRGDGDRFTENIAQRNGMSGNLRDLGESLRHMDQQLKEHKTILILRDLDCSESHSSQTNEQVVAACRSWAASPELMFKQSAVLCFCGRVDKVVDQQTASQCAVIQIDPGKDVERYFVLMNALAALRYDVKGMLTNEEGVSALENMVRLTAGLNLHQLNSVILESYQQDRKVTLARVAELKNNWIKREEVVEIVDPKGGFETIGGYQAQKRLVTENIVGALNRAQDAQHWGIRLPKGILLFGPPGTGKSLFARALAAETNLPFINLKTENLYKKYLGESSQSFAKAIKIIEKNAPALVFIDEIDRFGSRRDNATSDGASQESRRVFNQLLEWLGGDRGSILVGTTNRPEDLDPALMRAGRLDYKIAMLYPDLEARKQILHIHLGMTGAYPRIPIGRSIQIEAVVETLAQLTEFYSGAELEELVQRVRRTGFVSQASELNIDHIESTVRRFRINLEERTKEVADYERLVAQFADQDNMAR